MSDRLVVIQKRFGGVDCELHLTIFVGTFQGPTCFGLGLPSFANRPQ